MKNLNLSIGDTCYYYCDYVNINIVTFGERCKSEFIHFFSKTAPGELVGFSQETQRTFLSPVAVIKLNQFHC